MPDNVFLQGQEMTDTQIAELEAARAQEEAERLAPYREAAATRRSNAAIVAEHDEAIVEILYEITLNDLGLEA